MDNRNTIPRNQSNVLPTLTRQFRSNNLENQTQTYALPVSNSSAALAQPIDDFEPIPADTFPAIATAISRPVANQVRRIPEGVPNFAVEAYYDMLSRNTTAASGTTDDGGGVRFIRKRGGRLVVIESRGNTETGINDYETEYVIDPDAYEEYRSRRNRQPQRPVGEPMRRGFFSMFSRR